MLKMYDHDAEKRQLLPSLHTADELATFRVSQDRHRAYATLWTGLAYVGVLANTALWLYM